MHNTVDGAEIAFVVFEKIALFAFFATDRQTNGQTDGQTDG